jgi:transcriptional regulator with XRE-family HTH domain
MTWLRDLGLQIRTAREGARLSQDELASKLSVSRGQLSNYENGKCHPGVNVVTEIAEALDVQFVVRGYRITREQVRQSPVEPVPEQLCFEFGKERRFPAATVTIQPSRDSIVITAIVSHRAS